MQGKCFIRGNHFLIVAWLHIRVFLPMNGKFVKKINLTHRREKLTLSGNTNCVRQSWIISLKHSQTNLLAALLKRSNSSAYSIATKAAGSAEQSIAVMSLSNATFRGGDALIQLMSVFRAIWASIPSLIAIVRTLLKSFSFRSVIKLVSDRWQRFLTTNALHSCRSFSFSEACADLHACCKFSALNLG